MLSNLLKFIGFTFLCVAIIYPFVLQEQKPNEPIQQQTVASKTVKPQKLVNPNIPDFASIYDVKEKKKAFLEKTDGQHETVALLENETPSETI